MACAWRYVLEAAGALVRTAQPSIPSDCLHPVQWAPPLLRFATHRMPRPDREAQIPTIDTQACILDGNKYAARCREEGEQSWDILRDCMVLRNQRREPLLTSSACANDYEAPQVRRHWG